MSETQPNIKSIASELVAALPENATWDDLMYRVYVRQCIEAGIGDSENNCVVKVNEVRKQFGLAE